MFGLLSFRGTTGRIAWLVTVCAILTFLTTALAYAVEADIGDEDVSPMIAVIVLILAIWLVWAATARRLRDLGASHPVLEAMFSLLFFGFGWIWLFVRCAFFPSVGQKPNVAHKKPEPHYDYDTYYDEDTTAYNSYDLEKNSASNWKNRTSRNSGRPKNPKPTVQRMR